MITVGIIGGIGSGKSFISRLFGYPVFNADNEVKYIYKKKNITSSFIDYIQIFKYYVHGDLFDYIEKNNEYLDSNQKLNITSFCPIK